MTPRDWLVKTVTPEWLAAQGRSPESEGGNMGEKATGGVSSGSEGSGGPNRGSGMSMGQWIREMTRGGDRKYGDGDGRGKRGSDWGPSGPVDSPAKRINDLAQLLASKGLLNLAAAQVQADAGALGGGLVGAAQKRDKLNAAVQRDLGIANPSKDAFYRGPQRAGNTGKAGSGFGGMRSASEGKALARQDSERRQRIADQKDMARFQSSLDMNELAKRIALIRGMIPNVGGSRTTDTSAREELVNIAGRPEKRELRSTQTKDNSMEILQQIMRMV